MALNGACHMQRLLVPLVCQRQFVAAASSGGVRVGGRIGDRVSSLFKSFNQRLRRNPRIIPHARVKAFKVRPWRESNPDFVAVYGEHNQHYEMQMDALCRTFYYELHGCLLQPGESAVAGLRRLSRQEDHLDDSAEAKQRLDESMRLNAEWNSRSAEHRAATMRAQLDHLRDRRDRLQLETELAEKTAVLSFQARLKRDLAESASFIDESNLDEKIEAIIDSPIVNFNFAIDPAGNIIRGAGFTPSSTPPVEPPAPPSLEELSVRV